MNLSVNITGLDELIAKTNEDLITGPVKSAIEDIAADLATPKGDGIGVQRNILGLQVEDMAATITTTTVWPRTSGEAWALHTEQDFDEQADARLEAAGGEIQQGWGG